jgi:hypothetical protein
MSLRDRRVRSFETSPPETGPVRQPPVATLARLARFENLT